MIQDVEALYACAIYLKIPYGNGSVLKLPPRLQPILAVRRASHTRIVWLLWSSPLLLNVAFWTTYDVVRVNTTKKDAGARKQGSQPAAWSSFSPKYFWKSFNKQSPLFQKIQALPMILHFPLRRTLTSLASTLTPESKYINVTKSIARYSKHIISLVTQYCQRYGPNSKKYRTKSTTEL